MRRILISLLALLPLLSPSSVGAQHANPGYSGFHLAARLPLGDAQGWDYLAFEPRSRLLYISHERDVLVVNPASGRIVDTIRNTPGVHGIAFAPELGRGFISDGDDSSVTIFALATRRVLGRVVTGGDPDAIVFDSVSDRVFTMNADGKSTTAIDAATGKVAGTLALGGGPEFAVADGRGHLFVNIETTSELVEIDTRTLALEHRWPVSPCATPSALSMDRARRRLFLGCRNHVLAVVDANAGGVLQSFAIGDHVDASVFDADRRLVFVSNGDGTMNVLGERGDSLVMLDTVRTQAGAKTMAFDPSTHELFLVTAKRERRAGSKGEIDPGTFTLLRFRPGAGPSSAAPGPAPALVVFIAIDQMRPDYFDRWRSQFTGGLGRIRAQSAFFPHGLENHANTETAPGHSTMLSGREPTHTGVVSNDRGVPDPASPLIGASGPGASPRRFLGTTLFDWMLVKDPRSRVLSVSRKDRGAILPVGRAKGSVFWYADGGFTTSRYYADTLPQWVGDFNARHGADALAGSTWELMRPDADYGEPDSMPFEHGGSDFTFPHALPATAKEVRDQLSSYPWMDSLTLAFALDGVRTLSLGEGDATDLLSISLSTTDAVGHAYGPDSREMHDHLLHLDKWLGVFLDSLATFVPANRIVLALTSDHGVTSFPEYLASVRHVSAGRISLDDVARSTSADLVARYHTDFAVDFGNGLLTADTTALRARGLNVDSIARAVAQRLQGRSGVRRIYTPRTLANAKPGDIDALRWRNAIPPDVAWLVCVVASPNFVWSSGKLSAEHGTLNELDVRVPIAFMGAGISARTFTRAVRTVDIAPTLAAYLGVRPTERLDGVVLSEVVRGKPVVATRSSSSSSPRAVSGAP
ncbi:MAG: alkaline phosphatase family protein [Gemmatimonadaceae bacterium]|nr:alkaline phosphatase family protein [Gemmatimonadaceae bacterium]